MAAAPSALQILHKGLTIYISQIKDRREVLIAKLSRKETLSPADEEWLDNVGNTVDEQRILDILDDASDYERGMKRLDENGKATVEKLRECAGHLVKTKGNKRKRTNFLNAIEMRLLTCRIV